jgi:hypothetical protein
MHVLLIIIGALLVLFGGGCGVIMIASELQNDAFFNGPADAVVPLFVFGFAPLFFGALLIHAGVKRARAKRQQDTERPS